MDYIPYKGKLLLPAKSDVVFKAVFGQEEDKDILAGLLSGLLDLPAYAPEQIAFTNVELSPEYEEDKRSLLDVRIQTARNEHINIEIQLVNQFDMIPRSVYYLSRLYASQMTRGRRYADIGRAIGLSILNFSLFADERYCRGFRLKDTESGEELFDRLEIHYVELNKIRDRRDPARMTPKELWALFLATNDGEVLEMLSEQNAAMDKAFQKLQYVSESENMRRLYDEREKVLMDALAEKKAVREESFAEGITKGKEIGVAEGITRGRAMGVAEGITRGKAMGVAEGTAIGALETNTKTIRQMLNANFTMPMIYLSVPLPRPEIDAIIAGIRKENH